MGIKPPETTLDREDTNGNYEPGNCRWATHLVQQNNRSNNVVLEIDGQRKTITEWARVKGFTPRVVRLRAQRKWPLDALFLPLGTKLKTHTR